MKVLARSEFGAGQWSHARVVRAPILPPSAPDRPTLRADTTATLLVRWTSPADTGGSRVLEYLSCVSEVVVAMHSQNNPLECYFTYVFFEARICMVF